MGSAAACPPFASGGGYPSVYRPRNVRASVLYQLLETYYEQVKALWEDRFEKKYGFWRGFVDTVVARYLDCGVAEAGEPELSTKKRAALRKSWARLIKRVYQVDPLKCECGGTLRVIAFITEHKVVRKILDHLDKQNGHSRAPPNH